MKTDARMQQRPIELPELTRRPGITSEERLTAYHEAGHGVAAIVLGYRCWLDVNADQDSLGRACHPPPRTLKDALTITYGGPAAEMRASNRDANITAWISDMEQARAALIEHAYKPSRADKPWTIAAARESMERAKTLVQSNWRAITYAANQLQSKRFLSHGDLARIVADYSVRAIIEV